MQQAGAAVAAMTAPARMFMESLTKGPELENSQGQNTTDRPDLRASDLRRTTDVPGRMRRRLQLARIGHYRLPRS